MTDQNLIDLLKRAADRHGVGSPPVEQMLTRDRRLRRRRDGLLALGVAACIAAVVGATFALTVQGVSRDSSPGPAGTLVSPGPRVNSTDGALTGTWAVKALVGTDGQSVLTGPLADKVSLTFDNGQVTGTDGCNGVFGRYEQNGNPERDIEFTQMGSTLMACLDTAHNASIEPPLVARLDDVRHLSGSGDVRYLHAANWMIIAKLERHPTSPVGSGTITGIGYPCIGPMSPPTGYLLNVRVLDANGNVLAHSRLASPYHFTFTVPPGRYTVAARGDRPATATVKGGKSSNVVLGAACY